MLPPQQRRPNGQREALVPQVPATTPAEPGQWYRPGRAAPKELPSANQQHPPGCAHPPEQGRPHSVARSWHNGGPRGGRAIWDLHTVVRGRGRSIGFRFCRARDPVHATPFQQRAFVAVNGQPTTLQLLLHPLHGHARRHFLSAGSTNQRVKRGVASGTECDLVGLQGPWPRRCSSREDRDSPSSPHAAHRRA